MVFTRSKLNELSKEELIEELLSFDNLSEKINYLTKKMDDFATKFDRVFSELQISKTCKALSLTGNKVFPDDLEACHRLKKRENVIIKFKSRKLKYKIINNRKIMKSKSKELNESKFSNNLYIYESMCAGNHGLFFKCRKLKKARNIFDTWFFNNAINVQLNQNGEIHKVFHTEDLAALLKVNDLDSFLMNL